jgi:CheY-like chemotaxis protein
MKGTRPILLIEDDRVDVISVKRAFKDLRISNTLEIASDGQEGLEFLANPDNQTPCLILLDINMPRMNGLEFLKVVKKNETLKRIPVIVLTTSRGDQELVDSFDYGVAGYMVKPANYLQFMEVMKAINLYWTISEIPGQGEK